MQFQIGDYVLFKSDIGDDLEEFRLKQIINITSIETNNDRIHCDNGLTYYPKDIRTIMLESEAYPVINDPGSAIAIRMLVNHLCG